MSDDVIENLVAYAGINDEAGGNCVGQVCSIFSPHNMDYDASNMQSVINNNFQLLQFQAPEAFCTLSCFDTTVLK